MPDVTLWLPVWFPDEGRGTHRSSQGTGSDSTGKGGEVRSHGGTGALGMNRISGAGRGAHPLSLSLTSAGKDSGLRNEGSGAD